MGIHSGADDDQLNVERTEESPNTKIHEKNNSVNSVCQKQAVEKVLPIQMQEKKNQNDGFEDGKGAPRPGPVVKSSHKKASEKLTVTAESKSEAF